MGMNHRKKLLLLISSIRQRNAILVKVSSTDSVIFTKTSKLEVHCKHACMTEQRHSVPWVSDLGLGGLR